MTRSSDSSAVDPAANHLRLLSDLEARHEALFDELEQLERRVERVLAECTAAYRPLGRAA